MAPPHDNPPAPRSALAEVLTWTVVLIAFMAVTVKLARKMIHTGRLQRDDVLIGGSMACAIVYCVVLHARVEESAGIDGVWVGGYEKATYANEILYAACLGLARLSILEYLRVRTRFSRRRLVTLVLVCANCAFTLAAVIVLAFQCGLPRPWDRSGGRCIDVAGFWSFFAGADALLDVCVAALPVYLLHDLRVPLDKRILTLAAFGLRALTLPSIITRLIYTLHAPSPPPSFPRAPTIATSLQIATSILSTCIPFTNPILATLHQSGLFAPPQTNIPTPPAPISTKTTDEHSPFDPPPPPRDATPSRLSRMTLKPLSGIKPLVGMGMKPAYRRSGSTASDLVLIHKRTSFTIEFEPLGRATDEGDAGEGLEMEAQMKMKEVGLSSGGGGNCWDAGRG
ncbi:hypothetical protein EJ05DRAFT_506783 [Pseudovirgaria hyperparasitica]|uniref:Rhodopsin domain-containing protein n=1 Tax=Pseudovirgaria hyperparasitica TaxID=470096 RepID=A0A6A6WLR2_9PEZI|nr:uncharacterized protein EJ05DRAFT_506783 [Pseudovirgaria hyperparasitica]KAF2763160.1 hypothetical protein EJ05DRAFT_506783 [Pseudovirgaria hyperparasitica]